MKHSLHLCLILPLLLIGLCQQGNAQYLEGGIQGGVANYLGDLTPSGMWTSAGDANAAGGLLLRFNVNSWVSLRAGFHYGQITATDANASNEGARKARNLSFRSTIYEASFITEINIFGYRPYVNGRSFTPYLLMGIAGFKFNPQAEYDGQWYDLQVLGTEGQGLAGYSEKYKTTQVAVPLGFGFKYALSSQINFGLEAGMRKTFTDYLDDVSGNYPDLAALEAENGTMAAELSWRAEELNPELNAPLAGSQRGDPNDLDWYIFSGVSLTYNFINTGMKKRSRKANKIRCPKF